jgi:hypothetical protein
MLMALCLMALPAFAQEPAPAEQSPTEAVAQEPQGPKVEPLAAPAASAVVTPEPKAEVKPLFGFDEGFFMRTEDEKFKLRIGAQVQTRFKYESVQTIDDAGEKTREGEVSFSIPRGRLKLDGNAFTKRIKYEFQADFGKGTVGLKEYWVDAEFIEKALFLKVGQFKRPFSRQQITSSSRLEMVDVALTDKAFGAGYDLGLMLHNNYTKSPTFEWAIGVFNGVGGDKPWFEGDVEGTATPNAEDPTVMDVSGEVSRKAKFNNVPVTFNPQLVARVGFNTKDLKGYAEADLEGGPARFGTAISAIADFDADNSNDGNVRAELDYMLKVHGFSSTGGFYLATAQDDKSFLDQSYAGLGWHVQAGYVIKGVVQPVVRYGAFMPDGGDNDQQELMGGLAVYFFGHNLKWQTDGGALINQSADGNLGSGLVRTQLQLAF